MTEKEKVAAIGTFDGLHRGHQAVLNKVKWLARENQLLPVAVTFDRHPLAHINPERAPESITSAAEKTRLIRAYGVSPEVYKFDEELRATTAAGWLQRMAEELGVKILVAGYDNTFGSDGVTLSIEDYRKLGQKVGIEVVEAPVVEGVSSSVIRKKLKAGEIEAANEMLGRSFVLSGHVGPGNRLGRTLGYPTANLRVAEGLLVPGAGVYAAMATLPDGKELPAMVNIGVRPTLIKDGDITVEAHLIGWEGDLYDKRLMLRFIKHMRGEEEFSTIDHLRLRLDKDREETLDILKWNHDKFLNS